MKNNPSTFQGNKQEDMKINKWSFTFTHLSIIQQWNKKAHAQMKVYYKQKFDQFLCPIWQSDL